MKLLQSLRMALRSIATNKMRSFLTMLGIIIGVSAVIILVSLVESTTKSVTDTLEDMGTNMISVTILGRGSTRTVDESELFRFAENNDDIIECVAPMLSGTITAKGGSKSVDTSLEGTNEAYKTVRNTNVQEGRFFNALDIERRQKVALIGTYVATEIYGSESAVGQKIKLNGDVYTIIGLLESKSNSTAQSADDKIIIPYTTAMRLMRNATIRSFYVQGKTPDTVDMAMSKLQDFLFKKFQNEDSYRVFNQADMLESINEMTGMLTMMLGGIAGISLLVGGIGIMNIMLVSVTERTKEIGIRKAIGAKRRNILQQFLIEAVVVSCMGGAIGIMIGYLGSNFIGKLMELKIQPSLSTIMLSVGFSMAVGIFFGLYPANKASKLNPIEALRTE